MDGRSRTVLFTNDMLGQVVRRDEADNQSGGDPDEIWYRYSGRQQGYVDNNGTIDTAYAVSVKNCTAAQGKSDTHSFAGKHRLVIPQISRLSR